MSNWGCKNINSNDIYYALKEDILNLRLIPGQQISENEIAVKYNVSRTPVKTAFLKLSSEKFIEIVPQKGTYVTLLDMEFIKEIIYMRTVLESSVIKEIIEKISEEVIYKMEQVLKKQENMLKKEKVVPSEFYGLDSNLHEICFEFAGKPKLWRIIQDFQVYYTRFRMLDIVETGGFQELYREHCQMVYIIKNNEIDKLDEFMKKHLYGNINRLGDKINNELKDYFINV